jgi:hypothetical protein
MNYVQVGINSDKCKNLISNRNGEAEAVFTMPDMNGVLKVTQRVDIDGVFRSFGVLIDIRKYAKMKFTNERNLTVRKIITRIPEMCLKANQIINAFKKFALPRVNDSMMNSIIGLIKLEKFDLLVRKTLNELVGLFSLSKDMFYSSWKYGGFGIKKTLKKYSVCKINNLAHFWLRDEDMRRLFAGNYIGKPK